MPPHFLLGDVSFAYPPCRPGLRRLPCYLGWVLNAPPSKGCHLKWHPLSTPLVPSVLPSVAAPARRSSSNPPGSAKPRKGHFRPILEGIYSRRGWYQFYLTADSPPPLPFTALSALRTTKHPTRATKRQRGHSGRF